MPIFSAEQLKEITMKIFEVAGTPKDEASIVTNHLVKANLYGHDSHGVQRLPWYVKLIQKGSIKPGAEVTVVRESPTTILLDGNWGFGQVATKMAMNIAIKKARKGIGAAALFNCVHIGRLGEYSAMATDHGMIGIVLCNTYPNVAPHGGAKAVIGTNPISIGVPSINGRPILLDIATSIVAAGKIDLARDKKQKIPEGWIIDSEGRPTTNPEDLRPPLAEQVFRKTSKKGALLPFGGHKGFGLGLIIEVLGGVLAGSGVGDECKGNGVVTIAINIESFKPLEEFKNNVDKLIRTIKESPKAPGIEEILIAGEPEFRTEELRLREGILIEDDVWKSIEEIAKELGVTIGV